MKRFLKHIVSLFIIIVIIFSLSVPAFADYSSSTPDYWGQLMMKLTQLSDDSSYGSAGDFAGFVTSNMSSDVCTASSDHYHHADSLYGGVPGSDSHGTYVSVKCKYCNNVFKYYTEDLSVLRRPSTSPGKGYYTVPTTSTVDSSGNVTNYYRSGDTTNIPISNSFNKTFNSFQNNTYTTNNNTSYYSYQANVDLSNFLNTYTYNTVTNNYNLTYNSYTYNTTNNYYTYYLIDNSTTNYNYDIQVEYAPQYTQVTYVSNSETVNNVTNIYYYELYDGRSSVDISVNEVMGLATDYSAGNYELVVDDPDTLSLQHFDGNYDDSSAYGREVYSVNRSSEYIDSGDFGQALKVPKDCQVGITIPDLETYESICIEFRYCWTGDKDYGPCLKFGDIKLINFYRLSNSCVAINNVAGKYSAPANDGIWHSVKLIYKDSTFYYFFDGDMVGSFSSELDLSSSDNLYFHNYAYSSTVYYIDEFRVSTGSFVENTSAYNPAAIPFDTNKVLALPDDPEEGKIYVRSSIPVTSVRIGGVRPSNPSNGFVYIPLDSEYKGAGAQISDGVSWTDVDAYVYEMGEWNSVLGYRFLTVGDYGDDVTDPDDPDPSPSPGDGGSGSGGDDSGVLDKLGELLGTLIKGLGSLIGSVAGALLEALTSLAEMISEGFTQIVETILGWFESIPDLFSGFLGFLSAVFPFLPDDIMLLLTFGMAAVVFIGILKAVRR